MRSALALIATAAAVAVGSVGAVSPRCGCSDDTATVFAPTLMPHTDTHDISHIHPATNISLHYASNISDTGSSAINVTHSMKYPAVLLEQIASITNVDCSADSVAITFNDSTVFEATETSWSAEGTFVLITNHLGDCDVELERGMFLVKSFSFNDATLIATASSESANVSSVAAVTEVSFGGLPGVPVSKRALVLDPSYSLTSAYALPADTVLYSYPPYLTVEADKASFNSNVTFSGYLKYNWLQFKVVDLYFDIDTEFAANLAISATAASSYATTFSYSPAPLTYSVISVPGILELGPELKFAVNADVAVSEAVTISAGVGIALADGNVHLDLLTEKNTGTSGWTPTYTASADISGNVTAKLNPTAALTVDIGIKFFGGLLDLSTGVTAKPGFQNSFVFSAAEGIDLNGVKGVTSTGTCPQGLELKSNFTLAVEAFATQWWSEEVYAVTVPIVDKCYSWKK